MAAFLQFLADDFALTSPYSVTSYADESQRLLSTSLYCRLNILQWNIEFKKNAGASTPKYSRSSNQRTRVNRTFSPSMPPMHHHRIFTHRAFHSFHSHFYIQSIPGSSFSVSMFPSLNFPFSVIIPHPRTCKRHESMCLLATPNLNSMHFTTYFSRSFIFCYQENHFQGGSFSHSSAEQILCDWDTVVPFLPTKAQRDPSGEVETSQCIHVVGWQSARREFPVQESLVSKHKSVHPDGCTHVKRTSQSTLQCFTVNKVMHFRKGAHPGCNNIFSGCSSSIWSCILKVFTLDACGIYRSGCSPPS
jgi:hypothetical protein